MFAACGLDDVVGNLTPLVGFCLFGSSGAVVVVVVVVVVWCFCVSFLRCLFFLLCSLGCGASHRIHRRVAALTALH